MFDAIKRWFTPKPVPKVSTQPPAAPEDTRSPWTPFDELPWIGRARRYIGLAEIPGPEHEPTILKWWTMLGTSFRDDETPWCGAFVGGVLIEAGLPTVSGAASARSWLKLPKALSLPAYGCVVIFWRGSPSSGSGHVGFVVGEDKAGNLMVLGGNQGDMVSVKPFPRARVLGYRWPSIAPEGHRYNLPLLDSDGRISTNEA